MPSAETHLALPRLVLGGNVFGWTADEASSFDVLDAYVEAGGTHVDTADVYSAWQGTEGGESETVIGRWLASRGRPEGLTLATKVGSAPGYDRLTPEAIRGGLARSLDRLGVDRIDLYYAHRDKGDPLEPTLETFDALVREGLVGALAVSNFSPERLREALALSARHGWTPFTVLQAEYSLVERAGYEEQFAALAAEHDLAVLPFFGLARGYLTGKYRPGGPEIASPRAAAAGAYVGAAGERVLRALAEVADAHGVARAAVALAWLTTRPQVAAALASARSTDQLADLLPVLRLDLAPDEVAALDAASSPQP